LAFWAGPTAISWNRSLAPRPRSLLAQLAPGRRPSGVGRRSSHA
jgi:hypothetical protein